VACDYVVVVQPAGGVAIGRRFNLAGVVIGAIQIQNVNAHILHVCVRAVSRIMLCQLLRLRFWQCVDPA
jgi:hypothetical protein